VFAQDLRPQESGLHGGLGNGLTPARSVVAMHGGRSSARSEGPGRGSEFEIVLPLQAVGDH
jgi:signal transduction histidine kinase